MRRHLLFVLALLLAVGCAATTDSEAPATPGSETATPASTDQRAASVDLSAPLLDGMGPLHHEIDTDSELVQRLFDQGLTLAYGFNHAEASRTFVQAAELDPDCAMCWWGAALVLGPNINAAMDPADAPVAHERVRKAVALKDEVAPRHRAYIEALAERYEAEAREDRSELDRAYAEAMGEVARRFPEDLDAATLYGEALMDTTPWDYWRENGEPKPVTETILATFESVLERQPNHPGANHLYIHAVEAVHPERGIQSAERLEDLVPGAGHLVHMPSHIYVRVGRYHDATMANERAIDADQAYVATCHAQGIYPIAYIPHNHHFLWFTAAMEGRAARAIEAAEGVRERVDIDQMREEGYSTLQHYWSIPLYAVTRFARWERILDTPAPPDDLVYPTAVWRYARARALIGTGQLGAAADALATLRELAADPILEEVTIWDLNTTAEVMAIAVEEVAGELALARGDHEAAIDHFERAVALEDSLTYDEPPTWHAPARQSLGAAYLAAGEPTAAEEAFRGDLDKYPDNGWSLWGLERALRAQDETEAADEVRDRFERAWRHADVDLTT